MTIGTQSEMTMTTTTTTTKTTRMTTTTTTTKTSSTRKDRRGLSALDFHDHMGKVHPTKNKPIGRWTYIHIPKTAGDTFMVEAEKHMLVGSILRGNREWSLYHSDTKVPTVVFLREPTSHVLSQFLECKYDKWGKNVTYGTGFPGYLQLKDAMTGFDPWVEHFSNLLIQTKNISDTKSPSSPSPPSSMLWGSRSAYNCYDPNNMQTRYFTTTGTATKLAHFAYNVTDRIPNIQVGLTALRTMKVVGIVEYFPASLCLFEYHSGGKQFLTEECQLCNDDDGGTLQLTKSISHASHGVPPHAIQSVSNTTMEKIRNMTQIDQEFYERALQIFHEQIDEVYRESGIDLLCRRLTDPSAATQPPLSNTVNTPISDISTGEHNNNKTKFESTEVVFMTYSTSQLVLSLICFLVLILVVFGVVRGRRSSAKQQQQRQQQQSPSSPTHFSDEEKRA